MSVIEKLDSVVMLCDVASAMVPSPEGVAAIKQAETAAADFVIENHDAIRQAMIDARRYRWLRDQANFAERVAPQVCVLDCLTGESKPLNGAEVDAVIDDRLQKIETGANHADA